MAQQICDLQTMYVFVYVDEDGEEEVEEQHDVDVNQGDAIKMPIRPRRC